MADINRSIFVPSPDMAYEDFDAELSGSLIARQAPTRQLYDEILAVRHADGRYLSHAFMLGMAFTEHQYGNDKKSVEVRYKTRSWGMRRSVADKRIVGTLIVTTANPDRGSFVRYPHWFLSVRDCAYALTAPGFVYQQEGRETVWRVNGRWAPANDRDNDPQAKARAVATIRDRLSKPAKGATMALQIIDKLTPHNHYKGRNGAKVKAVVWHVAEGGESGVTSWFHNPTSEASTNYLVCKDGRVIRHVREEDSPWANGAVNKPRLNNPVVAELVNSGINLNRQTVSIETERYTGDRLEANSPRGRALAQLTREVMQRHKIPIDDNHILGHNEIDSVNRPNCPGNLDWDGPLAAVKGGAVTTPGSTIGEALKDKPQPARPSGYMLPGQADTFLWPGAEGVIVARTSRWYNPDKDKFYDLGWTAEGG